MNNQNYYGTGFLISEEAVLNYAHNIIQKNGTKEKNIEFKFFKQTYDKGELKKLIMKIGVFKIHVPDEYYIDPVNSQEYFCLLILNKRLYDHGYFGLHSFNHEKFKE